jgi:hypothetical protein
MENKQRLEALRGAFRGLSENHHRVLVMRELEGLSYGEIATRMGMSRPMVESVLFRARRRLGEEFEELSSGRRCEHVCEVVDRTDASTIRVLGIRARRQVALHLSHCDTCRRYARLAGADESLFRAPTFAEKVAALLPFGWLGRRLGGSGHAVTKTGAHGFIARHMTGASQSLGSAGSSAVLGRVAAAVLVIAAAGGGYAGVSLSGGPPPARKHVARSQPATNTKLSFALARAQSAARVPPANPVATAARPVRQPLHRAGKPPGRAAKRGHSGRAPAQVTHGSSGPAGGSGASRGTGAAPASGTGPDLPHTSLLQNAPSTNALAPIAPNAPNVGTITGTAPALHTPNTPALPSLPKASVPPAPVPAANNAVNQVGQTAGGAAGSATNTVSNVAPSLP